MFYYLINIVNIKFFIISSPKPHSVPSNNNNYNKDAGIFYAINNLFTAETAKSAADTANMKGKPMANLKQETSV